MTSLKMLRNQLNLTFRIANTKSKLAMLSAVGQIFKKEFPKCYGTHFQMILENILILINLKVLFYHGTVKIAIVLLVTRSKIP